MLDTGCGIGDNAIHVAMVVKGAKVTCLDFVSKDCYFTACGLESVSPQRPFLIAADWLGIQYSAQLLALSLDNINKSPADPITAFDSAFLPHLC